MADVTRPRPAPRALRGRRPLAPLDPPTAKGGLALPARGHLVRFTDSFGGVVYVDRSAVAALYDLWQVDQPPQRARVDNHVAATIMQRHRVGTQIALRGTQLASVNVAEAPDAVANRLWPGTHETGEPEADGGALSPLLGPDGSNVRPLRP